MSIKVWFPECPLFGGKNTLHKRFGTKDSVRCSEFRGGRFSEVANVLQVWGFQSVTRTLSALGSVSAQGGSTVYVCIYAHNVSCNKMVALKVAKTVITCTVENNNTGDFMHRIKLLD